MKKKSISVVLVLSMIVGLLVMAAVPSSAATANLSRPTVSATNVSSVNKILVQWDKVTGAKKYEVYYKESTKSKWSKMTTYATANVFPGAKFGHTYCYQVRPIATNDTPGPYSKVKSITYIPDATKIYSGRYATEKGVLDEHGYSLLVKWTKVEGASYYQIARKHQLESSYTYLNKLIGTQCVDSPNRLGKYYYQIRAAVEYNGKTYWTKWSKTTTMNYYPLITLEDHSDLIDWENGTTSYYLYMDVVRKQPYKIVFKESLNNTDEETFYVRNEKLLYANGTEVPNSEVNLSGGNVIIRWRKGFHQAVAFQYTDNNGTPLGRRSEWYNIEITKA